MLAAAAPGAIGLNCCTASLVSSAAHSVAGVVVTGTAALGVRLQSFPISTNCTITLPHSGRCFPFEWVAIHIVP
jgi:hypothetical protein